MTKSKCQKKFKTQMSKKRPEKTNIERVIMNVEGGLAPLHLRLTILCLIRGFVIISLGFSHLSFGIHLEFGL